MHGGMCALEGGGESAKAAVDGDPCGGKVGIKKFVGSCVGEGSGGGKARVGNDANGERESGRD